MSARIDPAFFMMALALKLENCTLLIIPAIVGGELYEKNFGQANLVFSFRVREDYLTHYLWNGTVRIWLLFSVFDKSWLPTGNQILQIMQSLAHVPHIQSLYPSGIISSFAVEGVANSMLSTQTCELLRGLVYCQKPRVLSWSASRI